MAGYYLRVVPISTGSVIAIAAARAGVRLTDDSLGLTYDYTGSSTANYSSLIGYDGSRRALWNQAAKAERQANAIVAREYSLALFQELSPGQNIDLVRAFASWFHQRHGVATDVAVHHLGRDLPFASIVSTTRVVKDNQIGPKSRLEWNSLQRQRAGLCSKKKENLEIQTAWADCANRVFGDAGVGVHIDPRPLSWFALTGEQQCLHRKLADLRKADLVSQREVLNKELTRLKAQQRRDAKNSAELGPLRSLPS